MAQAQYLVIYSHLTIITLFQAKVLRKYLPLNYSHLNSNQNHEPANIMIQKPEGLQETVNAEMVEYLDNVQMKFLVDEVAQGASDKEEFLKDLKLVTNKDTPEELREDAEDRIKKEVLRHGVWIGHGDLLTMKMFYVAKCLRYDTLQDQRHISVPRSKNKN